MIFALGLGGQSAAAVAVDPGSSHVVVSEDDETYFRAEMTKYDVPQETQDALFKKLRAGQTWDADLDASVPVSTEEYVDGSRSVEVVRYADGSIAAVSVDTLAQGAELDPDAIQPRRWLGCQVVIGSVYNTVTDCGVDWTRGTTVMKFFVDGRIYHNGYDQILTAHTCSHRYLQGTSSSSCQVDRKTETAASKARASMRMTGDIGGACCSRTHMLVLELGGGEGFRHFADW